MNTVYLLLGSNLGDKLHVLQQAAQLIEKQIGSINKVSGIYITAAWGNTSQPDFINQAIRVHTSLSADEVLQQILEIEKTLGRVRDHQKWKERIIDIDILFYNNCIIDTSHLTVPHPYLQDRKFVLIPLLEIAPDLIHPIYNKSVRILLNECTDTLEVKSIKKSIKPF
ncbi:MAG: 2-amino-4-hydroxy-6-hydroxymethyldihydropteridine diphosphokinase [Bacteroidota bacterium]